MRPFSVPGQQMNCRVGVGLGGQGHEVNVFHWWGEKKESHIHVFDIHKVGTN